MGGKDIASGKILATSERKGEVYCSWSLVLYLLNPLGILQLLNIAKNLFGNVVFRAFATQGI